MANKNTRIEAILSTLTDDGRRPLQSIDGHMEVFSVSRRTATRDFAAARKLIAAKPVAEPVAIVAEPVADEPTEAPVAKPTKRGRPNVWADRVDSLLNASQTDDGGETITVTIATMEALGLPAAAMKFPAYWGANPAGKAARVAGWTPSLRKVARGSDERVLVFTRIVEVSEAA